MKACVLCSSTTGPFFLETIAEGRTAWLCVDHDSCIRRYRKLYNPPRRVKGKAGKLT